VSSADSFCLFFIDPTMLTLAGIIVVLSPASLLAVFGVTTLFRIRLSERSMARFTEASVVIGLVSALFVLAAMLATSRRNVPVVIGDWVRIPAVHSDAEHGDVANSRTSAAVDRTTEANSPDEATPKESGPARSVLAESGTGSEEASPHETNGTENSQSDHFHFRLKFVFDRLSVPFVIMTFVLCGVIGAFASRYLHLDEGFHRFFVYFSFFQLGMILSSVAGTIETLFFGWELVGLSSALLVAFFHDRPAPVQNGLRVWAVYRIADAAFLVAALTLHHLSGSGDFEILTGLGNWPEGKAVISEGSALFVGCLLLIAAAGKSALVPFSGWLPRAMEGPTPSSAVFYGALSVHLGAFLLLRVGALLDESLTLRILVITLGLVTAVFAAMTARVQTDVKSGLAFASLIQVSIIVVEIGFGLRYIPLIHIIGHACLRSLQLVRAPSLLRDYNAMINAIGEYFPERTARTARLSPNLRSRLYRFAFERGNLDSILDEFIVRPFVSVFEFSDRTERRWTAWLAGTAAAEDEGAAETNGADSP
jgi:NADH-quinone oxidoreductase subunit L